jgi:hypothetical protein
MRVTDPAIFDSWSQDSKALEIGSERVRRQRASRSLKQADQQACSSSS